MKTISISKRLFVIVLAVMTVTAFMPGLFRSGATASADDTDTVFEFKVNTSNATAQLTKCTVPEGGSTDVEIPSTYEQDGTEYTVTSIKGGDLFSDNITSVTLPATVTNINGQGFNISTLKSIKVAEDSTSFTSEDGVLYSADGKTLYRCPRASEITSFSVPDTVGTVCSGAFSGVSNLQELDLSNIGWKLPDRIAQNCTKLSRVTFAANLKTIGNSAFSGCTSLQNVTLPASLSEIGWYAFMNCPITKIDLPESVSALKDRCFANTKLKSIDLPQKLQWYGLDLQAFDNCSELESINAAENSQYFTTIDGVLFYGRDVDHISHLLIYPAGKKDKSYRVPDQLVGKVRKNQYSEDLGTVRNFSGNPYLESLDFNKSLLFDKNDLCGCSSLKEFKVSDDNKSMKLVDGALVAGKIKFLGLPPASSITECSVPETVETLDGGAFKNCRNLKIVNLPDSIKNYINGTFEGCSSLEAVNVDKNNKVFSSVDGVLYYGTELVFYPFNKKDKTFVIPNFTTKITYLSHLKNLQHLYIPDGIVYVSFWNVKEDGTEPITIYASADNEVVVKAAEEHNLKLVTDTAAPTVTTESLEPGIVGTKYRAQLNAESDTPYRWSAAPGTSLPKGLKISSDGVLSGTPEEAGTFTVSADAYNSHDGTKDLTLTIKSAEDHRYTLIKELKHYQDPDKCTTAQQKAIKEIVSGTTDKIIDAETNAEADVWLTVAKKQIDRIAGNITLMSVKVSPSKTAYTGKNACPAVRVSGGDRVLKEGTDFTTTYRSNSGIGTASVTIKGTGSCNGTVTRNFQIVPAKAGIRKVRAGRKTVTVQCTALKGGVSYQIAAKKKGTGKWHTRTAKTAAASIHGLKSNSTYYVKARAYKKVRGKTYYGAYSQVKTVRVK
ncbi:MAG: leucine-rich repeat protein [Anaerovoracaceae bacterium]|jgi:Leucine-rich repeat (LRR) protein